MRIKIPKFQEPKFGMSLRKWKGPGLKMCFPKAEVEPHQLRVTSESAGTAVGLPALELHFVLSEPGEEGSIQGPEKKEIKSK